MIPILIPAYRPGPALAGLVTKLRGLTPAPIIVVDDGSGAEYAALFESLNGVELLRHAVNRGKGAALKTGLNQALLTFPGLIGVVTADADGQHAPKDIVRVAERLAASPKSLVMGVRSFAGKVPLRSRIGNAVTRRLMSVMAGVRLTDTQTGLRGIPDVFIPHLLTLPTDGYEFELDMLLACKDRHVPVIEEPIQTIYQDGNRNSHFRPLLDSMRIYFLLLRFTLLSLATALVDNTVFILTLPFTGSIARSQIAGRLVAMLFQYLCARSQVFQSKRGHAAALPRYIALVAVNGLVSYAIIRFLGAWAGMPTIPAKLAAEGLLWIASFAIQRDFIFGRQAKPHS